MWENKAAAPDFGSGSWFSNECLDWMLSFGKIAVLVVAKFYVIFNCKKWMKLGVVYSVLILKMQWRWRWQKLSYLSAVKLKVAISQLSFAVTNQYKPLNRANMYSSHGCDNVTLICVNSKHVYDSVCTVWSTRQQWAQLAQLVFRLHKQDGNCWWRCVEVWLPCSTRWMFWAQHGATLGSWILQILPVWVKVVKVTTWHCIFPPDKQFADFTCPSEDFSAF